VCILTVGSTIPKFTLHPAGKRFRRYAATLVKETSIAWAEYHARSDAISFYKFDPVSLMRFYGDMTQAEIGQQLGISQMHVSRLLSHALGHLRQRLLDPHEAAPRRKLAGARS